jgi:hypothetical protein
MHRFVSNEMRTVASWGIWKAADNEKRVTSFDSARVVKEKRRGKRKQEQHHRPFRPYPPSDPS